MVLGRASQDRGAAVADVLHLYLNAIEEWLTDKTVPTGKPPFAPRHEALLHLLAIHRSLSSMFSKPANQRAWLAAAFTQAVNQPV